MGIRGELFSKKVLLQNRSYFFNVKENRKGDLYLNIVESKNRDEGGFERQSVVLFEDDLQEFLRGFDESLRVLEKAVREKRRAAPKKPSARPPAPADVAAGRAAPKRFTQKRGRDEGGRGAEFRDKRAAPRNSALEPERFKAARAVKAVRKKNPDV